MNIQTLSTMVNGLLNINVKSTQPARPAIRIRRVDSRAGYHSTRHMGQTRQVPAVVELD